MQTPKGSAKGFYRRRKLNNYNLTIYDYGTSQGINNIWNEFIAGRGSNEVGSCLYRFIEEKALRGTKEFSFYSDACGGQNRNRHILSLFWFVLRKFNLTEIRHTFFVSGHSQNEVDNVHSRIEQESNPIDIFTTAQWAGCIRNARRKPPRFQVNELDLDDFYNIKDISQNIKNFETDTNNQKIEWLKIKRTKINKEDPNLVYISYDYEDNSWFQLNFCKKGRRTLEVPNPREMRLKQLRQTYISIDKNKMKDLNYLCRTGLIPRIHHSFYNSLPVEK